MTYEYHANSTIVIDVSVDRRKDFGIFLCDRLQFKIDLITGHRHRG
jgi:hypothetical protein